MELTDFVNPTIEIQTKKGTIKAVKPSLREIAEFINKYDDVIESKKSGDVIIFQLDVLYKLISKVNPEVTQDMVDNMFDLSSDTLLTKAFEDLGFTSPQTQETQEK